MWVVSSVLVSTVCGSYSGPLDLHSSLSSCCKCVCRYGVNGGTGGAQSALGKRLGKWLMSSLQQQQTQKVKVATS